MCSLKRLVLKGLKVEWDAPTLIVLGSFFPMLWNQKWELYECTCLLGKDNNTRWCIWEGQSGWETAQAWVTEFRWVGAEPAVALKGSISDMNFIWAAVGCQWSYTSNEVTCVFLGWPNTRHTNTFWTIFSGFTFQVSGDVLEKHCSSWEITMTCTKSWVTGSAKRCKHKAQIQLLTPWPVHRQATSLLKAGVS